MYEIGRIVCVCYEPMKSLCFMVYGNTEIIQKNEKNNNYRSIGIAPWFSFLYAMCMIVFKDEIVYS
jgi:hypothetical protein